MKEGWGVRPIPHLWSGPRCHGRRFRKGTVGVGTVPCSNAKFNHTIDPCHRPEPCSPGKAQGKGKAKGLGKGDVKQERKASIDLPPQPKRWVVSNAKHTT